MRTLLNTTLYFYNITLIYQPVCLVNTVPQRPLSALGAHGGLSVSAGLLSRLLLRHF